MAQRVRQAHRIDRRRVVVAQVFHDQVAAGCTFQGARAEHADPLRVAVAAQETVQLRRALQFAVKHQQSDQVAMAAQLARRFAQGRYVRDIPVVHRVVEECMCIHVLVANAQQALWGHSSSKGSDRRFGRGMRREAANGQVDVFV
jgi:hypothetical protein